LLGLLVDFTVLHFEVLDFLVQVLDLVVLLPDNSVQVLHLVELSEVFVASLVNGGDILLVD